MLSKSPTPAPAMKTAFSGGYRIRLASGLPCPHCGRKLPAHDAEVIDGDVLMICSGCHRDVMLIERVHS